MDISGITVNNTACIKHVREIKSYVRTVEERMIAATGTLLFEILPHQLIVEISYNAVH